MMCYTENYERSKLDIGGEVASRLAVYLEERMKQEGWSPSDLAAKAKIRPSVLSYILNKERSIPKPITLERLAGALGVEPARLTLLAGYPIDPISDPDARYLRLARELEMTPWVADRIGDLLRVPREEFDELMEHLEFRRQRQAHRSENQSKPSARKKGKNGP